jgi:hypothetical protein
MKTSDLTQVIKNNTFENANNKTFYIRDRKGNKYEAKLYGKLLNYPVVAAIGEYGQTLEAEINWYQAQRIAEGTINTISI